jgi:hypothetical protein
MSIKSVVIFIKALFLCGGILLISGCYNLATSKATPQLRAADGSDVSYIVGVIGVSPESPLRPTEQLLRLRMKGTQHWAVIRMKQEATGRTPFDIEDGALGVGSLFALAVKPGDYEIYYMRMQNGGSQIWSKKEFSVTFSLKPHKAFYIGDFRSNCLGRGFGKGCHFLYEQQFERDEPLLRNKFPHLPDIQPLPLKDVSNAYPFIIESNTALRP